MNNSEQLPIVGIWIKGAVYPNPGKGGWAACLDYGDNSIIFSGELGKMSNIRAEMEAAIRALEQLNRPCEVELYSNLQLLITGMQADKVELRQASEDYAITNGDLWEALDFHTKLHTITWQWIRKGESEVMLEVAAKAQSYCSGSYK